MELKWTKENYYTYKSQVGMYTSEIEKHGSRSFSWLVKCKEEIICAADIGETTRELENAKQRCRYAIDKHMKERIKKMQHAV